MIRIIHELRKCNGGNCKLDVLNEHRWNSAWKDFLLHVYDTSVNYYVSAPADFTFRDELNDNDWVRLKEELKLLTSRKLTGNAARDHAMSLSRLYGEPVRLILSGSLNAGVSITSINKAYPGLIPTFPVMLGADVAVTKFPVLASIKFDGVRLVVRVENGEVTPRTRSGKPLPVDSLISRFSRYKDGVYDCELIAQKGRMSDRTNITGSVNRVLKGSATDIVGWKCMIFDYLTLDEWDTKRCTRTYLSRLQGLNFQDHPDISISPAEQKSLINTDQINTMFNDIVADGGEGLILRYPEDPYVWKRSTTLVKKKSICECVLTCADVQEGGGKYLGMIGALICEGVVDGKQVKVKLGTGLSDFDRNQEGLYYKGKKIETTYNSLILAEGAEYYSLFLPRFKRVLGRQDI